jgi:hypothetical protein
MIYSQKSLDNIEGLRKNAISFNFLGPTPWIGITYERVLSKNFTAEIGAGHVSFGIGVKIYPWKIKMKKLKFYTGLNISYMYNAQKNGVVNNVPIYIPLGMSFFGKRGFNFGLM